MQSARIIVLIALLTPLLGCQSSDEKPKEVEGSLFDNRPLPTMDDAPDS